MPEYMVRVELHKANSEDYNDLHERMAALGLQRTVVFDDGKTYAMPIGTYHGSCGLEPGDLRDRVVNIATPLSSPGGPSVFLCKSQEWSARLFTD